MGVAFERGELEPFSQVVDVAPADLIGESQLVVSGGIELIEGLTRAVSGVPVAGREVVFRRDLHGALRRAAIRESASGRPRHSPNQRASDPRCIAISTP
jgi:hypothetical protein